MGVAGCGGAHGRRMHTTGEVRMIRMGLRSRTGARRPRQYCSLFFGGLTTREGSRGSEAAQRCFSDGASVKPGRLAAHLEH